MAFVPWHDHKPLILTALEVWQQEKSSANLLALKKKVDDALDTKYVKEKGDLLIEMNNYGDAYSSMDQADMGLALLEAGIAIGNKNWISLGKKALNVLLTDIKKGGLRKDCGGSSWFHGETSRSSKTPGGTLNKHLSATRDLIEAGDMLGNNGRDFRKAGIEGIKQLASDQYVNFKDFFVIDKGRVVRESWIYYSIDPKTKKQYFLDNEEKNPVYHVFVLGLIREIHNRLDDDFPLSALNKQRMDGLSLVRHAFLSYTTKIAGGNTGKKVPKGNYAALPNWRKPLTEGDLLYFGNTYT